MSSRVKINYAKLDREFDMSYGNAQKWLDHQVLTDSNRFVPLDTGQLRDSGISGTNIGSGEVRWTADYARIQYYSLPNKRQSTANKAGGSRRTMQWFEAAKSAYKTQWITMAAKLAGKR